MVKQIEVAATVTEKKYVTITPMDLKEAAKEHLSITSTVSILKTKYLESRGLATSAVIPKEGKEWEVYVDNGSHYSGMYSTGIVITNEDVQVMHALEYLEQVSQRILAASEPAS